MAATPTPDQAIAKEQLRHLRGKKVRLQEEKQVLQGAAARIIEINAEIDVINAQIDIIKVRDPDDQGGQSAQTTQVR